MALWGYFRWHFIHNAIYAIDFHVNVIAAASTSFFNYINNLERH